MAVPFKVIHDRCGNHVTYARCDYKEIDPYEFTTTLEYHGFERGRSALNIVWRDVYSNKLYRSGMPFLNDILLNTQPGLLSKAIIGEHPLVFTGNFGFKKQGSSVLLKIIA